MNTEITAYLKSNLCGEMEIQYVKIKTAKGEIELDAVDFDELKSTMNRERSVVQIGDKGSYNVDEVYLYNRDAVGNFANHKIICEK